MFPPGPLIEAAALLPNFVGIDCVTGKGEYESSASLAGLAFEGNRLLGKEFEYDCITIESKKHNKIIYIIMVPGPMRIRRV